MQESENEDASSSWQLVRAASSKRPVGNGALVAPLRDGINFQSQARTATRASRCDMPRSVPMSEFT